MLESIHLSESVFVHRGSLNAPVAPMVREALSRAEAQYDKRPTVCLLSGWDFQRMIEESFIPGEVPESVVGPMLYEGAVEVVPVYNLLPGHCLVGWPEGEAPAPIRTAAAVQPPPESERVLSKFQSCLRQHKGRTFPLKRGSAPWRRELAIAKKLIEQCGGLSEALLVVEVYFISDLTSWQNPLSLSFVQKAAPSLLAAIQEEETCRIKMRQQAERSRAQLAALRVAAEGTL